MLVEFEHRGDVCVLRLHGRFATGQDSAYLRTRTDEIKCSGFSKVLADFAEVSYIDSTGIGFLIGIYTSTLKNPNGRFVLANLNRRVPEMLQLKRFVNGVPTYPCVELCLAAFSDNHDTHTHRRTLTSPPT